jgi:hypothetical protein
MDKTVKLASGAVLEISISDFKTVNALIKALMKEAKNIKVDGGMELDIEKAIQQGQYNFLKDIVCSLIASDEVENLIFQCFERCLYNKKKVNQGLFDVDYEARGDYFEMAWEVGKFNVAPFTKGLLSKLKTNNHAINTDTQKLK